MTALVPRRPGVSMPTVPVAGAVSVAVLVIYALAVAWPALLAPADPLHTDLIRTLQAPSLQHPFGTDRLGRDVLSRVVHGARLSLLLGVAATALAATVGAVLGLLAGLAGRVADAALSRLFDLLGSFPELLLALVLIAFTGPGTTNLILAVGIASVPRFARVMRAETRAVASRDYVFQAELTTASRARIVWRHVVPNALGVLPMLVTIGLGTSILGAAALSFLGFGPRPPDPEWGSMLAESRGDLRVAWWAVTFPGIAITVTVIAAMVLGRSAQRRFERRVAR